MRILKATVLLALFCMIAAACSSDGDDNAPAVGVTEPAVVVTETPVAQATQPAPTPAPVPTETQDVASTARRELADAIFTAMIEDDARPATVTEDRIRCLGQSVAGVFSDGRIAELGVDGAQLAAAYAGSGSFALGDAYGITDDEASQVVDEALECMDWREVMAEAIALDGVPEEQASCIATELSDEGIRSSVAAVLIAESAGDFGIADSEALRAFQACVDVRDMLFQTLVLEGISEQSARCVADGLPEELVEMMLEGLDLEDEEAPLEMMGELLALQNRCLTPGEIDSMGGLGG